MTHLSFVDLVNRLSSISSSPNKLLADGEGLGAVRLVTEATDPEDLVTEATDPEDLLDLMLLLRDLPPSAASGFSSWRATNEGNVLFNDALNTL